MIIVKLQGGLGNQMFQYAAGRAVSKRLNSELLLDPKWFKESTNRSLWLSGLNIPQEIISADPPKKIKLSHFQESAPGFDPTFLTLKDNFYLDGYFQSYKYFSDIEATIRKEFTLKDTSKEVIKNWERTITGQTSVSLHIRRGDYLWKKHLSILGLLPLEYYENAIKEITGHLKTFKIFVFSDDIAWTKENLKSATPVDFVSSAQLSPAEETYLISRCEHHIIANSSFSWWGAWLSSNLNKIVIAPKPWMRDPKRIPKDLLLPEWHTVNVDFDA